MLFTLFGATGDLTTKKLIPALYQLYKADELPKGFKVLCIGRRKYSNEQFEAHLISKMSESYPEWEVFKTHISYYSMDISDSNAYIDFADFVKGFDVPESSRKIFYLATAPRFFPIVAQALSSSGLIKKGEMREKIVFEKPFGEDLKSAKTYNALLEEVIDESQMYRIDHYLGKEMLQNVLTVRFANKIFENIWDAKHIDHVKIYALEDEGVKERGGYYDASGALKDMVQNHLFQTLSLVAMDPPKGLNDEWIKNAKVSVMNNLSIESDILLGQYDGYLCEKDIPKTSKTETFVALKVMVNTQRWKGMPFYLITGKKMKKKRAGIEIVFKHSECLFEKGQPERNKLFIEIFPREGIVLQFNGKAPGLQAYTMPMKMDYCHACHVMGNSPEAYEKLILDILHDESALFTRWDEVEKSWEVVEATQRLMKKQELLIYKKESDLFDILNSRWEGLNFEALD